MFYNFMAAVTICSDFGPPKNKVSVSTVSLYLPWSDGTGCHDRSFLNVVASGLCVDQHHSLQKSYLRMKTNALSWNFLPRSKRLLISWLQSPSAVTLEPRNIKSVNGMAVPKRVSRFRPLVGWCSPSLWPKFPWANLLHPNTSFCLSTQVCPSWFSVCGICFWWKGLMCATVSGFVCLFLWF